MGEKLDYPCLFYFHQFSINQPKLWVDRLKIKLAINMKQKGFWVVLLIFGFTTLFNKVVANPVTRQQAQKNVQAFLDKKGKKMEVAITDNEPSKSEESEYYYVFNVGDNNGYVIASGDDRVPAILGYSDKGNLFQGAMPDNMKEWLQEYEDQIIYMREHGLSSSDMQTSTHPAISPLLTTTWGQGSPYNQNCPDFFTYGKCVTGCVATAMAQVMYYHRSQSVRQTIAEIPAYQCRTNWKNGDETLGHVSVNAFPEGSVIDWDNMLNSYSGSSTTIQQQAVANLMAYCGASVKMEYKDSWNGGSGAYSEDVPNALKKYFDYNENTTLEKRTNYSDEEWDQLIYSELSKGNPIYYSGKNSSAGHAFVCDGYDGDGYYHINWGWTGTSDGYFLLSVLDPKDQGIGGSSSGYNQGQAALIGAIPNGEAVRLTTQALTISGNSTFSVGQSSNVDLSISITLKNSTGSSHNFNAAIGLYSKGSFVEVIKEIGSSTSYSSGKEISQSATLSVRTNLSNGVYQLIPISKETGTEKWNINDNSSEKYLTLVVKDGTMSFYVGKPSVTTEVISFADSEVKRICVENWDTDGDGELSYDEAAAVTDFGTVFDNSSIRTFDEAQYFTGIKVFGLGYINGCSNLISITLPSSVTSIKDYAFYRCISLKTIYLPSSVTGIGAFAFTGCSSLQTINLPEGLKSIGSSAFNNCSLLASIIIPSTVTSVGDMAFGGCTNLNNFQVAASNSNYCTIDGVLFTKDEKNLVQYPAKREGLYSIPNGTINVKNGSFYGSQISEVSFPESVKSIGSFAFSSSKKISTVSIPNTVTNIGSDAFSYCDNIESVVLPNEITSIPPYLFLSCRKLKTIILPTNITSIGSLAFSGCSALTEIEIPSKVTSIDTYAFSNSGLKTIRSLMETPCTIASNVFSGINSNAILYVPAGCKSAYSSADNWKNFSQIFEIGGNQPYAVLNDGTLTFYNDNNRSTREGTTYDLNVGSNIPGWYDKRTSITKVVFDNSFSTALPVTTYYWFYGCSNLTEIQGFENLNTANVTNMCYMFYNCSKLTNISLPTNLSRIYDHQFYYCSKLSTIIIPNTVTAIDSYAFDGCSSLQNINLPNVLETIGTRAFLGCRSINTIEIPTSVTSIGDAAFGSCTNVNNFVVNSSNSNYCTIEGVLYTKDRKILVQYPAKREGSYAIPSNTEKIGNGAFYGSKISSVSIPTSVVSLDNYAFYSCGSLTSVTIPDNVTSIGNYAFANCSGLNEITLPTSLSSIGDRLLYGCSILANVILPEHITSIGKYSFAYCSSLTQIEIPAEVTSIDNYAFYGCSQLQTVKSLIKAPFEINDKVFPTDVYTNAKLTVPSGTKAKYQSTSCWNKFTNIEEYTPTKRTIHVATAGTLPNLISESEKYIIEELTLTGELNGTDFRLLRDMAGCNYLGEETAGKLIVLDFSGARIVAGGEKYVDTSSLSGWNGSFRYTVDNYDILPQHVFNGCKFISVKISHSVTSIGYQAFYGCSGLTSITIPSSVTSIEYWAFSESGLTSIIIPSSVTSIGTSPFSNCSDLTHIEVESGNKNYDSRNSCNAIIETSFNTLVAGCKNTTIPSSVTSIGNQAFYGCSGMTSITIPNSVTSIGNSAFLGCSGLTSITIPSSVTSIDIQAFSGCSGLTSITIPSSVTSIGSSAFSGCSGLTSITIPSSVTSIGSSAFSGCSGLTSITIPSSMTCIGDCVFQNCSGLTSITIPSSVTSIGDCAFQHCSGLTSITIPSSVTSIGDYTFSYCHSLTTLMIPSSVTSIGSSTFYGCYQLQTVKSLIETPFEINDDVFPSTVYTNATLTIPVGTSSAYQTTNGWKNFTQIAEVDYTKEVEFTIDDELWVNCAESYSGRVTWSQIEFHLLDETLEGLSKNDFDNNYVLDYYNQSTRQIDINNETFHKVTCYGIQYNAKCGKRIDESRTFGTVVEEWNVSAQGIEDTTTHIIKWAFTFQELDAKARELRDIGKLEDKGDYYANRDPLVTWVRYAHLPYTPFTDTPAIGAAPEKGNPSIWVKLTIPAGAIRVAKGDMGANKNLTFWYDLNSKTNATSTKDAYEVRVNVPVPVPETSATVKTIGYSYLTGDPLDIRYDNLLEKANDPLAKRSNKVYTEFTKDLKDFFIDGKLSASIKDDQHFGSIKGLKLGCEFILPSTNYGNASFNAGKNHSINNSWTVKGYTGAEYTLILSADHTKIQIKAKDNTVYSEPVDLVTLNYDNNPVVADRQMTVLNYVNGVNQDDILNAYSHNELGEREAFTAYIVIRDVNACAPVVFDNRWFNVRFIRPLSVPNPKDDVIEDAPNDWQSISIMNYASVIDWRNYMGDPNNGNEGMDANNIFDFKYYGVTLSTNIAGILTDANLAIGERNDNFTKGSQININMDAAYMAKLQNISTIPNFQLEQVDGQTIKYKNNSGINGGFHIFVPVYMEYVFGTQTTPQVQYITIGVSNTPDIPETKQLYINDVSAYRGTQVTLPIQLDNEETLSGFQFDLELPEGIEFVKIEKTERLEDFSLSCSNISDNKYTIISFSMDGDEISTGNGTIVNLKVNIPSDYTAGDYITTMSNIKLMYGQTKTLLDDVTSILRVMACKPGDSDGDDVVDVADVVTTVNYILKRNPAKFVFESADIDKDNVIDVADVVGTVNIILKKNTTNYVRMRATEIVEDNDILSLLCNDDSYSLCLDNQDRYVAAQFDIRLVEGNVLESVRLNKNRMNGHQVTYNQVDENVYRVLIYSVGDGTFKGDEGELVSIQTSNGSFIDIENIKFVTIHQKTKEFDALHSGVNSINTTSQVPCIDIYTTDGRLVRKHATTLEGLNKGIYIINNKKIIVK